MRVIHGHRMRMSGQQLPEYWDREPLRRLKTMSPSARAKFDKQLEIVMAKLPAQVTRLLESTPLWVEDYPPDKILAEEQIEYRDDLAGLYEGIASTEASLEDPPHLNRISIYREGIVAMATDEQGRVRLGELRRQIRITILHEVGHHFGLDEGDLDALGYG